MKIVAFVVKLECGNCNGKKSVPGGQREYGELIDCPLCKGTGLVDGHVRFEDFAKLIHGLAHGG